jgi:hypothetical protein
MVEEGIDLPGQGMALQLLICGAVHMTAPYCLVILWR